MMAEAETPMSIPVKKEDLHRLIDALPDNATLDDLVQQLYVRECIEQGLEAGQQGHVTDVKDVRKRFDLPA